MMLKRYYVDLSEELHSFQPHQDNDMRYTNVDFLCPLQPNIKSKLPLGEQGGSIS